MKTRKMYVKPNLQMVNIELDSSIASSSATVYSNGKVDSYIFIGGSNDPVQVTSEGGSFINNPGF